MDASAFVSKAECDEILHRNMCDEVDIRDNRYHQVVHMVTSAKGAEAYYTIGESVGVTLAARDDLTNPSRAPLHASGGPGGGQGPWLLSPARGPLAGHPQTGFSPSLPGSAHTRLDPNNPRI